MRRRKKLIIAILLVILIGLIAVIAGELFLPHDNELAQGSKNILVCAIDESEPRPGMGEQAKNCYFTIHSGIMTLKNPCS